MWEAWSRHTYGCNLEIVMNTKLFVRVEGEEAVLIALQESLGGRINGQVRARKYVGTPPENYRPFYWMSREMGLAHDGTDDVAVQRMLEEMLEAGSYLAGLSFSLVVVIDNDEIEGLSGFYLNADIIKLVGLMGGDLDVDIIGSRR